MKNTAIIIPCYNRCEVTLACLGRLRDLETLKRFSVYLVDDASTDGTAAAVMATFPEVTVIAGNGDLYWTGATELGMRRAFEEGAECFVWLNDDTFVEPGAIEMIAARAIELGGIACGQGFVEVEEHDFVWNFPLFYRTWKGIRAEELSGDEKEIPVDTCRGNLVAVSREVVKKIGFPDGVVVPHYAGDTDYGLRASHAGLPVVVLPQARVREVVLPRTDNQSWLLGEVPAGKLWRNIFQKRNNFYPPMWIRYHTRHWGAVGFLFAVGKLGKLGMLCLIKAVTPQRVREKVFGRFSHAWKSLELMRAAEGDSDSLEK